MGHTVSSQRIVADRIFSEISSFGKALRQEDLAAFERLIARAKKHFGTISYADSYNTWALILLSIMLEQEKEISGKRETNIGKK